MFIEEIHLSVVQVGSVRCTEISTQQTAPLTTDLGTPQGTDTHNVRGTTDVPIVVRLVVISIIYF
jgi:hypothetical protein